MGLGNVIINSVWKLAQVAVLAAIYTYIAPFHFPADQPYTYLVLFLADDLAFYCVPPRPPRGPAVLGASTSSTTPASTSTSRPRCASSGCR